MNMLDVEAEYEEIFCSFAFSHSWQHWKAVLCLQGSAELQTASNQ